MESPWAEGNSSPAADAIFLQNLQFSLFLLTINIGVTMNFIKNTLVGIGAFTVIIGAMYLLKLLLIDTLALTNDTVETLFLFGALLFLAPMFGELTTNVWFKKQQ